MQDIFYVPQKPYTTIGSLREQIIYPLSVQDAAARQPGETEVCACTRALYCRSRTVTSPCRSPSVHRSLSSISPFLAASPRWGGRPTR